MKLSKTLIFFTLTGVCGLFAWLQTFPVNEFLLQVVCHAPANAEIVSDECTGKMVALGGKIIAGISGIGMFLRMITTSSLFITWFGQKGE